MLGFLGRLGAQGLSMPTQAIVGPYPAPTGYSWDWVYSGGNQVTSNGQPVVTLKRII